MMRSFLLVLLLSLFSDASVLGVASPAHGVQPAPWRRLSNFLVETIWGRPAQPLSNTSERQRGYNGRQHVPGNFLARYGRDVVLRFNVTNAEEASSLAEAADVLFLDVWDFTENWLDVRLAKDVVPSLLGLLPESLHTAYATLLDERSLSQAIADNYPMPSSPNPSTLPGARHVPTFSPTLRTSSDRADTNIFFADYQPMSVIRPWMQLLASMFTTHVRLINIGLSFEGRDIPAFRVGVHPTNDEKPSGPRKTIVIMGGSHAREWIGITSVTYLAYWFITQYGKSQPTTALLEAFDFVFIPTINPDGYVYTWDTDRLWRKNRQTTTLRFCRGVDLDRSYGFHWDGNRTQQNPCSESYAGEAPFEGVEAERLRTWAKNETENNNVEIVAFLDLHAYSQQVLYPYSFSCIAEPPSLENLEELALGLAKAMRTAHGGHFYKATSACEGNVAMDGHLSSKKARTVLPRIETGGGSAIDYFLQELHVKYSYQIKLRDTGSYGFLLPKEEIIPTGNEVVDAVLWMGRYLQGQIGLDVPETQVKLTKPVMERPEDSVVLTKPNLDADDGDVSVSAMDDEEEDAEFHIQWEFRRRR